MRSQSHFTLPPPPPQDRVSDSKTITYAGAHIGSGIYNATAGINSAVFKQWLKDYKNYTFDVEIGHATASSNFLTQSQPGVGSISASEDSSTNYLLLNSNYKLDVKDFFVKGFAPYLTAGIGFQSESTDISYHGTGQYITNPIYAAIIPGNQTISLSGIIYQIGAGFTIPVAETVSIDGRARYSNVGLGGFFPEIGVRVALNRASAAQIAEAESKKTALNKNVYIRMSAGLASSPHTDGIAPDGTVSDALKYQSAIPFGIAVGYKFDEYRVEGALDYKSNKVYSAANRTTRYNSSGQWTGTWEGGQNADLSVSSFMVNGYRDFVIKNSTISPYLTAGIGIAKLNASSNGLSVLDTTSKSIQAGAGVGINVSESAVIDLGLRYYKQTNTKLDNSPFYDVDITYSYTNLFIGVRYDF